MSPTWAATRSRPPRRRRTPPCGPAPSLPSASRARDWSFSRTTTRPCPCPRTAPRSTSLAGRLRNGWPPAPAPARSRARPRTCWTPSARRASPTTRSSRTCIVASAASAPTRVRAPSQAAPPSFAACTSPPSTTRAATPTSFCPTRGSTPTRRWWSSRVRRERASTARAPSTRWTPAAAWWTSTSPAATWSSLRRKRTCCATWARTTSTWWSWSTPPTLWSWANSRPRLALTPRFWWAARAARGRAPWWMRSGGAPTPPGVRRTPTLTTLQRLQAGQTPAPWARASTPTARASTRPTAP